ncbi:MAG: tetratricopeptide repeat protein [Nitrospiraceae bacterium]|nr:MAG: tetratricopeptide repeat protein [Nitrospiraceae bacterium]
MQRTKAETILFAVFLTSVFFLSIIQIEDTDIWTHLSFGKWIWEHGAHPTVEPFLDTGVTGIYLNWLFGILYYLAYLGSGIPGVILLMALSVTGTFMILLADSLKPYKNTVISVIILIFAVFFMRHRFVVRPDTFLMLFLSFSIFSLNAYVSDGRKYIYALPFTHMFWANSHTSIILMVIPFMSFLAGGFLQQRLDKKGLHFLYTPSYAQMKTIGLFFILSFLASLVSPYFISQYTIAFQLVQSDWWTQEIGELLKPTWANNKQAYIIAAVTLSSFVLQWFAAYRSGKNEQNKYASLVHLMLLAPFMYLSFTAVRFTFFLGFIGLPVLSRNLSGLFVNVEWMQAFLKKKSVAIIVGVVILAVSVLALKEIEPFREPRKHFGLGISYQYFPEDALAYMDKKGITGKIYNLFQWGGYITWRDFPVRKPLIDGRGFLDEKLMETITSAHNYPDLLDELEAEHGFESVLINYVDDGAGTLDYDTDRIMRHPDWALVYWDDFAMVYLKREGKYADIIKDDEYKFVIPSNLVSAAASRLTNKEYRDQFVKELQRNISTTQSSLAYFFLGYVYSEAGNYREAIDAYSRVRPHPMHDRTPSAYFGIAYAYGQMGDVEASLNYYLKSLKLIENPTLFYKVGLSYLSKGDKNNAVHYFEKALSGNWKLLPVYPMLISLYQEMRMEPEAENLAKQYEEAKDVGKAASYFQAGLTAYSNREYDVAIREFNKVIGVNPFHPDTYSNLGYIYFDMGDMDRAYQYQRKSIDIDPNNANAHYGIALVYKELGDRDGAKLHWNEYLRLQPTGYFSRKAKREIESLQ